MSGWENDEHKENEKLVKINFHKWAIRQSRSSSRLKFHSSKSLPSIKEKEAREEEEQEAKITSLEAEN